MQEQATSSSLAPQSEVQEPSKLLIWQHFPETASGEMEIVKRLARAVESAGWISEIVPLDRSLTLERLRELEAESAAALDIHFSTPKFTTLKSVGAVWTPLALMEGWGFGQVLSNQVSHDLLALTGSSVVDPLIEEMRLESDEFSRLNHGTDRQTASQVRNLIDPPQELHCLYTGINWDVHTGKPGRHDEVLRALDAQGLVTIHGPSSLNGLHPWKGFDGYAGPLPFDGRSVVEACRRAGVVLVWSSPQHRSEDIVSARLLEACAAGAVVLSDHNASVRRLMGDGALYVDLTQSAERIAQDVEDCVRRLENDSSLLASCRQASLNLYDELCLDDQVAGLLNKLTSSASSPDLLSIRIQSPDDLNSSRSTLPVPTLNEIEVSANHLTFKDLLRLANEHDCEYAIVSSGIEEWSFGVASRIRALCDHMRVHAKTFGHLSCVEVKDSDQGLSSAIIPIDTGVATPINGLIIDARGRADGSSHVVDPVVSYRVPDRSLLAPVHHDSKTVTSLLSLQMELRRKELRLANSPWTAIDLHRAGESVSSSLIDSVARAPRVERYRALQLLIASVPVLRRTIVRPYKKWALRRGEA